MKTKHGIRRMVNKGRRNPAKKNMKGEAGNNKKGDYEQMCVCAFVCRLSPMKAGHPGF